jgi:hypothetical protein
VANNREELRRARDWSKKLQEENASSIPGNDPELEQFRKQSVEFNARVHRALAEIPVPSNLREQILARSRIIPLAKQNAGRRSHRRLLAIAAGFVLMAALTVFWMRPPREDTTFAGFRSRMVGFAVRQYSMDIHTNQLAAVRSYLARNGAPADFSLPSGLVARPVIGGGKLSWHGKPVGMVCFSAPSGKTLYMFVIDSANTPGAAAPLEASVQKRLGTVSWNSAGRAFLLAGDVTPEELQKLVVEPG